MKCLWMSMALLLLSVIAWTLWIYPACARWQEILQTKKQMEIQWAHLQKQSAAAARPAAQIIQYLHQPVSTNQLMSFTEKIATQTGIVLISLQPAATVHREQLHIKKLTLVAQGQFEQILRFFNALLRLPLVVSLAEWDIQRTSTSTLTLTLDMVVFHD